MPPNQNLPTSLDLFALEPQQHAAADGSCMIEDKNKHQSMNDGAAADDDDDVDCRPRHHRPILRCAVLGCGMMGREHVSYLQGYAQDVRIDYLCDPHEPSLEKCLKVFYDYHHHQQQQQDAKTAAQQDDPAAEADVINITTTTTPCLLQSSSMHLPVLLHDENELLQQAKHIDLLVIATPNYLHTDMLLRWSQHDLTILLEKPVAISQEQHRALAQAAAAATETSASTTFRARVWVAMEYRYMPAITKLIALLPTIGQVKMCTIRENRFPFLHKVHAWNRDRTKTGDTLVEKCCHFFDLMRLITQQEAEGSTIRALVQRGLNYQDEPNLYDTPIIDAAYVFASFAPGNQTNNENSPPPHVEGQKTTTKTIGCLELCMYADGSRHQEEIIVTGTMGRLEAYLPENKVYAFARPSQEDWKDRSVPPPVIHQTIYDCSDVKGVHGIDDEFALPTHGGYHYSSTGVEWFKLLQAIRHYEVTGEWKPDVSLQDGLCAVEIGLRALDAIVNEESS